MDKPIEELKIRVINGKDRGLVAAVRDYCQTEGCGGILLTTHKNNLRGQRLYEHCGFERLGVIIRASCSICCALSKLFSHFQRDRGRL